MRALILLFALAVKAIHLPADSDLTFPLRWHVWKLQNSKIYSSLHEELERHITWLSNQVYIDAYNSRGDIFGFKLSMNEFGDLVS